ncbi:MAG TPA: glycoside hydrolase family 2 TIM barrel-domain containing protein, partial [Thermomicrobiales bacterium]|nr:glycoside hydrolase family 2 TIM barrel-domain containing protein [Thermomicrobiales bacterium]
IVAQSPNTNNGDGSRNLRGSVKSEMETWRASMSIVDAVSTAPNPQFARENRIDLTGEWHFAHDDADVGLRERWFAHPERIDRRIVVPYPPESRLSGIHDTNFHRVLWYARPLSVETAESGAHPLLHFGAVDYEASVWVDGNWVGSHTGGQTPFHFDIADALDPEVTEHWIVVRATDDPLDDEQPRGKQDWKESPHVIWYHRTSGIWQPVWLEHAPATHIESVHWKFDAATWRVDFEVTLSGRAVDGTMLRIDLEHEAVKLPSIATAVHGNRASGQIGLATSHETMNSGQLMWSPSRPNLIGARLTLTTPDQPDDEVLTYLGLRTVETSPNRIRINGQPIFLRLVLNQGYWPESQLTAPSPEALKREVELILELGFNGARNHQKVEDPRFHYWADRLGLLVWGEMPAAFIYTDKAIGRHLAEWRDAVVRDRNHPSVIAWVPFNESWGVSEAGHSVAQQHAVKAAYHTAHQLDGTRPVIGNDGWDQVAGDIFTIHDYTWDPESLARRYSSPEAVEEALDEHYPGSRRLVAGDYDHVGKPVVVSEFGGVSYAPASGANWFGYGTVGTEEEYLAKYEELTSRLHSFPKLAGFCYTQLTDTEQEINGLLTEDRVPKVDINEIRRITRGPDRSR